MFQPRDVNSAIATVRQKKICARPACAVETAVGRKKQHRDAAEQALQDHGAQRGEAEHAHPSARLGAPDPDRKNDREEADGAGDQPVAMLVEDPAHHVSHREREHRPAVAGGPVRNGEPGAGARDKAAGNNQKNRGGGKRVWRSGGATLQRASGLSASGSGF